MRRVLIVDDDRTFAESVQEELERDGYAVGVVHTPEALTEALANESDHVVLLDVRLGGPGGNVDGIALVPEILHSWPSARVIVVSGYVTADVVRQAYEAGAVDLLRKDDVLTSMLRFKVRRAADEAERSLAADPEERERALRDSWKESKVQTNPQRKGAALERTVGLILASIPGLESFQRVTNKTEEIDLVVANRSPDPFLLQQGPVWLVECKNWSAPTGVPEVAPLLKKMRHRRARCRLGIAVSMNGFADTVQDELNRESTDDRLIVTLTGADLDAWIAADDRARWIADRILIASTR